MRHRKRIRLEEEKCSQLHCNPYWLTSCQDHEVFGGRSGLPLYQRLGSTDAFYKNVYQSMSVRREAIYDPDLNFQSRSSRIQPGLNSGNFYADESHGGIFNVSFSASGSVLVAATEKKAILTFDPLTHKRISLTPRAHMDSVNYIKFLDSDYLFASCSDDNLINLWDLRQMKQRLMSLTGHTYWVKNLEYDSTTRRLVSSGYDGSVKVWDIFHSENSEASSSSNNDSNNTCVPNKTVLRLSCLMRMRLSPDLTKMIVCTGDGFLVIIHDLNLDTMEADLRGFQIELYYMMQDGYHYGYDFGSWFNHLFTAKRNRIEIISDFPPDQDVKSLTSIDVHPSGWALLSRGITRNDDAEWSCVHDIQDDMRPNELTPLDMTRESIIHTYEIPLRRTSQANPSLFSDSVASVSEAPSETPVSPVIIISGRSNRRASHATILNPNQSYREIRPLDVIPSVYKNIKRLTHYQREANVGHGFIKELSFSPDGRVICSPFEYGFRISSFDQSCREMSFSSRIREDPSFSPKELNEVKRVLPHANYVVTTKFSPTHHLIASGCLSGRVVFTQPSLQ